MLAGHKPLVIPEVINFLDNTFLNITWEKLTQLNNHDLDIAWRTWLTDSPYHDIKGLEQFKLSSFCSGTSDAFGEFISRYPSRTVRVSRNDFILTKVLCKTWNRKLVFLEDSPLERNDCVILSMPYSGNGSDFPDQNRLLDSADELDIPVFVDGAYFGISTSVIYPLDRKCITDFTISLTKNMVSDPLRLGIRFTKEKIDDGITAGLLGGNIFDRLGSYISIQLLKNFSHQWLIQKYYNKSLKICTELKLTPTKTITLALGPESMTDFQRGDYIRICITDELIAD